MYVLCSPCVLNPSLRAEGITKPSDLEAYRKAKERCKKFNIEMVPLPCPETIYLGPDRKPGTFLERLDTPEFFTLMDSLTKTVDRIIELRGPPLCILGVNSSPTCGITSTYYGAEGDKPSKREGRGVFLARFPHMAAVDAIAFAKYHIYLAAPLFSEAERRYNASIARLLRDNFFEVHLPQEKSDDTALRGESEQDRIFHSNKEALDESDLLIAIIDGSDADSGTAWEMGYTFARGKPVIAIRTDFRRVGKHEQVNLMLEHSAKIVISEDQLITAIRSPDLWNRK